MVKKTLVCFVVLFALNAIFWSVKREMRPVAHEFWQANEIIAQQYIYDDIIPENVIVGSSIGSKIIDDSLSATYNMSFVGQSPHDGLEVITKSERFPKRVFIEKNTLTGQSNKRFIEMLFNPFMFQTRKTISAMQDGKGFFDQSISYIENGISGDRMPQTPMYDKGIHRYNVSPLNLPADLNEFMQINEWRNTPYSEHLITRTINALKYYIDILDRNGVEVIFYEMPYEKYICYPLNDQEMTEAIKIHFPADKYRHMPNVNCGDEYSTFDGIHLDTKGAINYTLFFRTQMENYK